MTASQSEPQRFTRAPVPLRGTQSLVGVMGFVWRHPSLTGIELLWRWGAVIPLLYLLFRTLGPTLQAIPLDTVALGSMTFLEPVRSAAVLARQIRPFYPPLAAAGRWWVPLALLVWTVAATAGRSALLHRAERLRTRFLAPASAATAARSGAALVHFALYVFLRSAAFLCLLALWLLVLRAAVRSTVVHPLYAGDDPNLVLLTAETVVATLAAFLLWSAAVWPLDLAPLRELFQLSPTTAAQRHELRSKLIETNLVMGIVRVAILVLALTFSASPLPFQSRETQEYINVWWTGVAIFYIFASDFFHVVRRVTYLRLLQSITQVANSPVEPAS